MDPPGSGAASAPPPVIPKPPPPVIPKRPSPVIPSCTHLSSRGCSSAEGSAFSLQQPFPQGTTSRSLATLGMTPWWFLAAARLLPGRLAARHPPRSPRGPSPSPVAPRPLSGRLPPRSPRGPSPSTVIPSRTHLSSRGCSSAEGSAFSLQQPFPQGTTSRSLATLGMTPWWFLAAGRPSSVAPAAVVPSPVAPGPSPSPVAPRPSPSPVIPRLAAARSPGCGLQIVLR